MQLSALKGRWTNFMLQHDPNKNLGTAILFINDKLVLEAKIVEEINHCVAQNYQSNYIFDYGIYRSYMQKSG